MSRGEGGQTLKWEWVEGLRSVSKGGVDAPVSQSAVLTTTCNRQTPTHAKAADIIPHGRSV